MDPANKQPRIARRPAACGNERSMPRVWRTIINEGCCRQIADDEPRIAVSGGGGWFLNRVSGIGRYPYQTGLGVAR